MLRTKIMQLIKGPLIATAVLVLSPVLVPNEAMAWRRGPSQPQPQQEDPRKWDEFISQHEYSAPLVPTHVEDCSGSPRWFHYQVGPLFAGAFYGTQRVSGAICQRDAYPWNPAWLLEKGMIGFDLVSMSSSGLSFDGLLTLESSVFRGLMASASSTVRMKYEVKLNQCDGKEVLKRSRGSSLEELIEQFQGIDFNSFLRCELSVSFIAVDNVAATEFKELNALFGEATALANGQLVMSFVRHLSSHRAEAQLVFRPSPNPKDGRRREDAIQAAREFIGLIKSHGNEIIRASDPSLSGNERRMILMASLQAKKSKILDALNRLKRDYSQLELLEKFSTAVSVREAYDYVKEIEDRVGRIQDYSQKLNLGNVFNIQ